MFHFIYSIPISYYMATALVNFLTSAVLGIFVYTRNRRANVNRIFALFCLTVAQWSFFYFLWLGARSELSGEFYMRTCMIGVAFMPAVFTHFIIYLVKEKTRPVFLRMNYLVSFGVAAIIYTRLYAHDFGPFLIFPCWGKAGVLFPVHLVHFFANVLYSHKKMFRLIIKSVSIVEKKQIAYVFAGTVVGYLGGIANYLCWYRVQFPPVTNILVPVYVGAIAYAIVRHQLMDIEVIVKRTIVFAGIFTAAYAIFASFTYIGSIFFENIIHNKWAALAPSVFIIALILRPLENFMRNATDTYLFQKKYDYKELLKTFTGEVLTVLDMGILLELTVNKLAEIAKLENASILLYDKDSDSFKLSASAGLGERETGGISAGSDFWVYVRRRYGPCILLDADSRAWEGIPSGVREQVRALKPTFIVPLGSDKNIIGLLSLGKKKSDENFSQDDIDTFLPLARTLSIAVTNAKLVEELSQAQAQAAQREKMAVIGTLSAGINHEICNPLGIIRGQCELFLLNTKEGIYGDKAPDELINKAAEIMEKVIKETDRATGITKRLSSFAKPSRGEIERDIVVEKELEEVVSLLAHELKLDNILVKKDIQEGLPCIAADRKQFQEILFNLIKNAAQAIKSRGEIMVRATRDGVGKVAIDIRDTGEGISKSHLARIFDPFFTTKDQGKGSGLGLFLVKQITERNNGRISVESMPGEWTNFHLVFKAAN